MDKTLKLDRRSFLKAVGATVTTSFLLPQLVAAAESEYRGLDPFTSDMAESYLYVQFDDGELYPVINLAGCRVVIPVIDEVSMPDPYLKGRVEGDVLSTVPVTAPSVTAKLTGWVDHPRIYKKLMDRFSECPTYTLYMVIGGGVWEFEGVVSLMEFDPSGQLPTVTLSVILDYFKYEVWP